MHEVQEKRDLVLHQLIKELSEKCQKGIALYHFQKQRMKAVAEQVGWKNADQAKKKSKQLSSKTFKEN